MNWRWAPSGMIRTRPSLTASTAGFASSSIRQNHCSEISGSICSPRRWGEGTLWWCGSLPRAMGERALVLVRPLAAEQTLLAELGDDRLLRLGGGHTAEALRRRVGD